MNEYRKRVRCSSCGHLVTGELQGQATPVCICDSEIWKDKEEGPHVIKHDTEKPILCDFWKEKEGGTEA